MTNRTVLIFTILLACQLAGEVIALSLQLPVPGPVLGMLILFSGLAIHGRVTAVLVILTGILGSMLGTTVLNRIGVRDASSQGVALGLASHGIGTERVADKRSGR